MQEKAAGTNFALMSDQERRLDGKIQKCLK